MGSIVSELATSRQIGDRQRRSTDLNQQQPVQRDFGGVAMVCERRARCERDKARERCDAVFIDWRLVEMCTDPLDAINLCIDSSRQKDEALARELGIDKGHFCRIRKGMAHFPDRMRIELMLLCGNWAPVQFDLIYGPPLARLLQELQVSPTGSHHPAASCGALGEWRA